MDLHNAIIAQARCLRTILQHRRRRRRRDSEMGRRDCCFRNKHKRCIRIKRLHSFHDSFSALTCCLVACACVVFVFCTEELRFCMCFCTMFVLPTEELRFCMVFLCIVFVLPTEELRFCMVFVYSVCVLYRGTAFLHGVFVYSVCVLYSGTAFLHGVFVAYRRTALAWCLCERWSCPRPFSTG